MHTCCRSASTDASSALTRRVSSRAARASSCAAMSSMRERRSSPLCSHVPLSFTSNHNHQGGGPVVPRACLRAQAPYSLPTLLHQAGMHVDTAARLFEHDVVTALFCHVQPPLVWPGAVHAGTQLQRHLTCDATSCSMSSAQATSLLSRVLVCPAAMTAAPGPPAQLS